MCDPPWQPHGPEPSRGHDECPSSGSRVPQPAGAPALLAAAAALAAVRAAASEDEQESSEEERSGKRQRTGSVAGELGAIDSDDEPLVKAAPPPQAHAAPRPPPRRRQRFFAAVGPPPQRGDDKRARAGVAVLAARRAVSQEDDGRTLPMAEGVGRRAAARLQREVGPQLFMPDDVDEQGGSAPLRHRPQWLGAKAKLQFGCDRCGARSKSGSELEAGLCRGQPPAVEAAHPSHQLMAFGTVVFCQSCGARSAGGPTMLLGELCLREPSDKNARTRRNHMRAGRHPLSHEFIGDPVQLARVTGDRVDGTWGTSASSSSPAATG